MGDREGGVDIGVAAALAFYEWSHDTQTVTQYRRIGECKQCGECCRATVVFAVQDWREEYNSRNGGGTTTDEGLWFEVSDDGERRFWQTRELVPRNANCPSFMDNNRCALHFEKDKICSDWPMHPSLIEPFKNCGYSFEQVASWSFDELE